MKAFLKSLMTIIVLIYVLGMIAILSMFTHIPWLTGRITRLVNRYESSKMIASIIILVSVFLTIILLIIVLSSIPKSKSVIYNNNLGKLELSKKSIEAVAYSAVREFKEVGDSKASIKGNASPKKLKMQIDIEPRNASVPIEHLGGLIQKNVVEKLASCLSIDAKAINVKVHKAEIKADNTGKNTGKKQPRVI